MEGIEIAAKLMELSAVTAPKSKGVSFVQTRILTGESLQKLADEMVRFGERTGKKDFDRDAKGVARSGAVVLIGLKDSKAVGLDCGACGYPDCKSFEAQAKKEQEFSGPICAFRLLDMGIALGSAVKTASMLNVDNRIMYRIGTVARAMKMVEWDFVMGIPLAATGRTSSSTDRNGEPFLNSSAKRGARQRALHVVDHRDEVVNRQTHRPLNGGRVGREVCALQENGADGGVGRRHAAGLRHHFGLDVAGIQPSAA